MQYKVSIIKICRRVHFFRLHPQTKARNKSWRHRAETKSPNTNNFLKDSFSLSSRKTVYFTFTQPKRLKTPNYHFTVATFQKWRVKFLPVSLLVCVEGGSWRRACTVTSCSSTTPEEVRLLPTPHSWPFLYFWNMCLYFNFLLRGDA